MRILIVEDELVIAENIRERLEEMGYEVTAIAADGLQAVNAFRSDPPDLALVDIWLEGSPLDGIEVAQLFNMEQRVPIVFLTSLSDKATRTRARAARPANYLVKPCNKRQLEVALEFALENFTADKEPAEAPPPASPPRCPFYSSADYFFVLEGGTYAKFEVGNLLYAEADGSSVNLYFRNRAHRVVVSANLGSFERQLPHPSLRRIHRSYLVNVHHVDALDEAGAFVTHNGERRRLPVSKTYREAFFGHFRKLKAD